MKNKTYITLGEAINQLWSKWEKRLHEAQSLSRGNKKRLRQIKRLLRTHLRKVSSRYFDSYLQFGPTLESVFSQPTGLPQEFEILSTLISDISQLENSINNPSAKAIFLELRTVLLNITKSVSFGLSMNDDISRIQPYPQYVTVSKVGPHDFKTAPFVV